MPMGWCIGRNFGSRGGIRALQQPTATYILHTVHGPGNALLTGPHLRTSPHCSHSLLETPAPRSPSPRPSDIVPDQREKCTKRKSQQILTGKPARHPVSSLISGSPLDGRFNTVLSAARYVPTCLSQHASILTTPEPWLIVYMLGSLHTTVHANKTCPREGGKWRSCYLFDGAHARMRRDMTPFHASQTADRQHHHISHIWRLMLRH